MPMKLNLDRITGSPSEEHFEASSSWWLERVEGAQELDYEIAEPFQFDLRVYAIGTEVYLEGTGKGALDLECGRCLSRYRHALRDDFRLVLQELDGQTPPDPEGAESLARDGICLQEELELGWYRGREITLDAFFGEVISAAMPIQFLCSEGCAGLCPGCGARRDAGACGCTAEKIEEPKRDSPFAVLAKLRDDQVAGD